MARRRNRKLYKPKTVKCKLCGCDMELNKISGHKCPPKLVPTRKNGINKSTMKRSVVVSRYKKSFLNDNYTLIDLKEDNSKKSHKYALFVKK